MSEVIADEAVRTSDARLSRAPVQKRGQQRVEAILDAAEAVIGEMGVDAATTNAIAERAGSSVGSLYHFFPNKGAILEALAERYANFMTAALAQTRRIEEPWVPLEELFSSMFEVFAAMDDAHPGYMAVCRATDSASGCKSPISLQTEEHMFVLIQELLAQRCPGIPAAEARVHAVLSVVSVHAGLDHMLSMPEHERPTLRSAMVDMMVRYFTPIEALYPRPD
jgi:AcrR family transcriptional regulator